MDFKLSDADLLSRPWVKPEMVANIGKMVSIRYKLCPQERYLWRGRVVGLALAGLKCCYLIDCSSCTHPQCVAEDEIIV